MKQAKKRYYTIRQYFREKHIRGRQLSFQLSLFFGQLSYRSLTSAYNVRIIKVQNTVQLQAGKAGIHKLKEVE